MGTILSEKLNSPADEIQNESIQKLSEAAQLFLSVHHAISVKRKFDVNPLINDDSRAAAQQSCIDEFLFGSGFLERVKSCQSIKSAGEAIKKSSKKFSKPKTYTSNLNSKLIPSTEAKDEGGGEKTRTGLDHRLDRTEEEDNRGGAITTSRDTKYAGRLKYY